MNEQRGLLRNALTMIGRNKRYIFWFWLLNLTLAEFGTGAFRRNAHAVLDHSLNAGGLVHGFDLGVFAELLFRPEFGKLSAMYMPSAYFSFFFFIATALFLPGVFAGYGFRYRLPREDFFRACGRNLWRFIRLLIMSGILMGALASALYEINDLIVDKAGNSTNELLPFELQTSDVILTFLIMTVLRIAFDLAEADIVLSDRRSVHKSVAAGFRHVFRSLGKLLGAYVLTTIAAGIILIAGLWVWNRLLPPESVILTFILGQLILLLLLIPRFWQRAVAVTYWQRNMVPAAKPESPIAPEAAPVLPEPAVP
ncbi:MAG TPA: hypothetical protein VKV39_02375 [Candidatus Sulfotelmatobacter sp.]|nr:hypothetical protein [Candidatus Sulfotelmatobacter sp.]